jgi:hypothetical protein
MKKPSYATEDLDLYAKRVTAIDPVMLRDEYIRLPADLASWNARQALAQEAFMEADLALDRTEARLSIEWREGMTADNAKVTEGTVKERVRCDQKYVDARMAVIEAEVELARVKGVVQAILAKKEMLISLGAHVRAELNDPKIRQQAADRHHREEDEKHHHG